MWENYAFIAMNQSDITLTLFGLAGMLSGFLLALMARSGARYSMRRVPYLIWMGASCLMLASVPLAWLLTYEAINRQMLWVLVLFVFGAMVLFGMIGGILAHARSVNAYGNGRWAILATIPVLNLILFLKRPIAMERRPWVGGVIGSGVGAMFFALSGMMHVLVNEQMGDVALEAEFDQGLYASTVSRMVDAMGLENTLSKIARDTPGQKVSEVTLLANVQSEGALLRYTYLVDTNAQDLPAQMRAEITQRTCDFTPFDAVIRAGATIEDVYLRADGLELGRVQVSEITCSL